MPENDQFNAYDAYQDFSMEEVGEALREQGFGLVEVELLRNEHGDVDARPTIDHIFNPVTGGDGVVAGVLMKRDSRYFACIQEGGVISWVDVLVASNKGVFTHDEFLKLIQQHRCSRVYRAARTATDVMLTHTPFV